MAGPNGEMTAELVALYAELAANGVGLLFTGHLYVDERGRYAINQTGIPWVFIRTSSWAMELTKHCRHLPLDAAEDMRKRTREAAPEWVWLRQETPRIAQHTFRVGSRRWSAPSS